MPRTSATPEVPRHGSKPPIQGSLIKQQDRAKNNADSLRDRWPRIVHPSNPTRTRQRKGGDRSSVEFSEKRERRKKEGRE
ncbi:hypothetical protein RHMOL_Rhmol08G0156000 [Rhododendron molle]|uniref:Uncharacterized protein n=1 Tax=Rhododendron molle TaxID=49168 RepID=A0ACC0MNN4_RHOML|nr:hypothetical protein RHMOL_Rhmol08G0156000 [Rhododendron molle]